MTSSKIFKELTAEEIEKIVHNLYGSDTKVGECRLLKGGLFNTTYFVKTNVERAGIVLRVAPINQHLLLDFEKSMMSAEPTFYEILKENNIPSSEVIHYDNSSKVIEREYIIFRYIPSIPMNTISVSEEEKSRLYYQLGKIMALFHEITNDKFGWKRPQDELMMYAKWSTFLQRFAQEIADKTSNYGLFCDRELKRFLDIFSHTAIFDQIEKANLIHADFWEGNVLVSNSDTEWKIAGLIDVDKAIFGDQEMEYASPVMRNEDFLLGYGYEFGESFNSIFRRRAYQLLERFMYAYIWHAQFENLERYASAKRSGLEQLDKIEALI